MEVAEVARKARSGIRWTSLEMVIGVILRLAQVTVLARILGPGGFGVIAVLMVLVDFARLMATAGLAAALIQQKTVTHEQQSTLYWLNLGFGALVYVLLLATAPQIERIFGFPELAELISVTGLAIILMSGGTQIQSMIRRNMDFGKMAFASNVSLGVGLGVMSVSAIVFSHGVWSFVWGVLAEALVRLIVLVFLGARGKFLPGFRFSLKSVRHMLSFGAYRAGGMIANLLASRTDQILIGAFFSAAALGIYNLAYNFSSVPVKKLNAVVTRVSFPAFSRLQEDRLRLREGYMAVVGNLSIVTAPIIGGLAGIAPIFVPFVFGEEWTEGVFLIQIVLIHGFLVSITRPMGTLILGTGHANWSLYWNLGMLALKPLVISIAALSGSIYFVAWALVGLACLIFPLGNFLMVRRIIGNSFLETLHRVSKPAIAGIIMCAAILVVGSEIQFLPPVVQLTILIAFGGFLYLCLALLMLRKEIEFLLKMAWR